MNSGKSGRDLTVLCWISARFWLFVLDSDDLAESQPDWPRHTNPDPSRIPAKHFWSSGNYFPIDHYSRPYQILKNAKIILCRNKQNIRN
jgi:hypothetical protein